MDPTCFTVEIEDDVARIELSRPDRLNSMTPEFWNELPEIVEGIDDKGAARAIVLTSTGKHFTAGMDLAVFASNDTLKSESGVTRAATIYDFVKVCQRTISSLANCRIPVLAAIQGGCVGGGVDLITAADMRYATEDAFFCIQEINIGMTADVGTFPRLSQLIPDGVARELAYTGRRMPADEAKSVGLVNEVFSDRDAMISGVMDVAREIASKAPLAVYGTKRIMNYARDHSTADTLDYIGIWNASMLQPSEMSEAFKANAEKRRGDFADLPQRPKKL
ncbi:MAG: crotonase/enoyl-CoA hydratase family protein [Myxococcales bacterium]|nr:crotonase/enoyl-CoA hydratase family protein [Myxococcales bacterium]